MQQSMELSGSPAPVCRRQKMLKRRRKKAEQAAGFFHTEAGRHGKGQSTASYVKCVPADLTQPEESCDVALQYCAARDDAAVARGARSRRRGGEKNKRGEGNVSL
ncbi:hypothetical protein GOODEAATRI_010853 [Goodea atripinnis]|uniref:Uncharacterized protein n=1 Tax=Goodea atripinnis TaxID=208336 RepID=A0ABV0MR45_9TELE